MKKILSIVLAAIMVMALGVTAFAAETSTTETKIVTIYKSDTYGTTEQALSMANDAVNGSATVTTLSDGSVQIDIPIVPLYNTTVMNVFTADGYLTSVTVSGGTGNIVNEVANTQGLPHYSAATLRIVMEELPADGIISVTDSVINLYDVNSATEYWYSHVTPSFDIVLS